MPPETLYLVLSFLVVAALYASVGFGGGSSYLALLAVFLAADTALMRSTALLCNLVVVSGNVVVQARAGTLPWRRAGPLVALSVPAAYLGATLPLSRERFFLLLGVALVSAAGLLAYRTLRVGHDEARGYGPDDTSVADAFAPRRYPRWTGPALGGGIGLLSGAVGIGGGIFLSPVLHHLRWASAAQVSALASAFILVNSAAGLAGLASVGDLRVDAALTPACLLAVALGGQLGVRWGVRRFRPAHLRLATAALVGAVGLRILLTS